MVDLIRELQSSLTEAQRELMAKSEAASLCQGIAELLTLELANTRNTVKALEAPKAPLIEAETSEEQKPWWKFWKTNEHESSFKVNCTS